MGKSKEVVNLVDSDSDGEPAAKRVKSTPLAPSSSSSSSSSSAAAVSCSDALSETEVVLFTYNTDCLDDTRDQVERAIMQCEVINKHFYHVIQLQEVSEETLSVFQHLLVDYECVLADNSSPVPYFIATFVRSKVVKVLEKNKATFSRTMMGRGHIFVKVEIGGKVMAFINTHSESLLQPEYIEIRKYQMAQLLDLCKQARCPCVIAGDLNARDEEIKDVCKGKDLRHPYKGKTKSDKVDDDERGRQGFDQLHDAFIVNGSQGLKYTWACRDKPWFARFDRVLYLRRVGFRQLSYEVCMDEKLFKESRSAVTLSDHLGVAVRFGVSGSGQDSSCRKSSSTQSSGGNHDSVSIAVSSSQNSISVPEDKDDLKRIERQARLRRFASGNEDAATT